MLIDKSWTFEMPSYGHADYIFVAMYEYKPYPMNNQIKKTTIHSKFIPDS